MRNDKKIKTILGMALLFLSLTFVGCTSISGTSGVSGQETEKDSTSMNKEEDAYEDEQHEEAEVMQSPDKYTWYIKDYVGKNVAAFGYTSMGGDRMDRYGEGYVKLILVNEDGSYIDINNEEDLKSYIVAAQNIKPNTELKYVFEKDEEGEEYSLVSYQNIEEIVLAVKKLGSASTPKDLTEITVSPDQYTWYIRDYVGRNLSFCGYASMGGEYRDAYGASTIVFVLMPDDGTYIEPDDEEAIKRYVVTGQSVTPNTELKLELMTDENGEEYGNLVQSQNIQEIELYLSPVEE
ncbi:hypothetical protein B5F13_00380 [Drancourtella sp. An177]|nr:hypothetical protein B5F13_00380 [Drancourtella sp. An177]